jgi:hypothetical protein
VYEGRVTNGPVYEEKIELVAFMVKRHAVDRRNVQMQLCITGDTRGSR